MPEFKINWEDEKEMDRLFGRFNDLPPNFKEISEKEFAQSKFFIYSPQKLGFKQVAVRGDNDPQKEQKKGLESVDLHLYFFHDGSGFALARDYWKGKVRFFYFELCRHEWETLENRMCYHKARCVKCGYIHEVDSSG